ncbi:MAG: hypothetical protein OHK0017_09550 [Patescibacteria group bacterium]
MHNQTTNPFNREENLKFWFEDDSSYRLAKKAALKNFIQTNQTQPNLFMSLKDTYLNLLRLSMRHTVAASICAVLAISTITASAVEIAAPEAYKPSTIIKNLFSANKQAEKDPYTKISPDQNNNVISIPECDLAVKFPKTVSGKSIVPSRISGFIPNFAPIQAISIGSNDYSQANVSNFSVLCFDSSKVSADYFTNFYGYAKATSLPVSQVDIQQKYGWFITETELSDLKLYSYMEEVPNYEPSSNYDYLKVYNNLRLFTFKYNNFRYAITFYNEPGFEDNQQGLFGNQIQVQFNSRAQNEANVDVSSTVDQSKLQITKPNDSIETKPSSTPNYKPLTSDATHNVVSLDKCGLSVKYLSKGDKRSQLNPYSPETIAKIGRGSFLYLSSTFDLKSWSSPVNTGVSIECSDKPIAASQFEGQSSSSKDIDNLYFFDDEVKSNLKNVYFNNLPNLGGTAGQPDEWVGTDVIRFEYESKYYQVQIANYIDQNFKGTSSNEFKFRSNPEFKLQFNNLAKSTANISIDKLYPKVSDKTPIYVDLSKDISTSKCVPYSDNAKETRFICSVNLNVSAEQAALEGSAIVKIRNFKPNESTPEYSSQECYLENTNLACVIDFTVTYTQSTSTEPVRILPAGTYQIDLEYLNKTYPISATINLK